jgi:hypothetical protein
MNEIPKNLKSAMERYANTVLQMEENPEAKALNELVDELLIQVNKYELEIQKLNKPLEDDLEKMEDYIRGQVLELEATAKHAGVVATYSKPHTRTNWISKKMTDLCMADPELLEKVMPARSVKEYPAKVKVTYAPEPIAEEAPF